MRHLLVSNLAHVLLKNHFELQDVAARLFPASPFSLAMDFGQGRSSSLSVNVSNGSLNVSFIEGDRGYALTVPVKGSAPHLRVSLTESGKTTSHDIKPEDFVAAKLPEAFAPLHEKVTQYLKSLLPAGFFDKRPASEGTPSAADPAPAFEGAEAPAKAAITADATPVAPQQPLYMDYVVHRLDQPDLRFKGKLVAAADTWPRNGRQHHVKVFQTPSGKYIGIKLGTSMWPGELDRVQVQVADRAEDLVPFFGYNALAKALYQQLNLVFEEVID